MAFSLSDDLEKVVDELIARYPTRRAACIPVLHLCQEMEGWVSPDIIDYVATRLDMSTAQVKGVVTFYTMYHQEQVAPNVIWVCRTLSCDLRGAKTIQEHLEDRLGCGVGGTSKDGKVTLLKAECLASCGTAPMIQLNDEFHEDLDVAKMDAILDELGVDPLRRQRSAPPFSTTEIGPTDVPEPEPARDSGTLQRVKIPKPSAIVGEEEE